MKATDLSKIIYECDIHALTDYYSFVEVEYDDADNNTINVFRHGYDCEECEIRVFKGKLYRNVQWRNMNRADGDPIEQNETINTINWQFIIWGNDYYNDSRWTGERGDATSKANIKKRASKYLIIGDMVFMRTTEPIYNITCFGCNDSAGMFVDYADKDSTYCYNYSALQREECHEELKRILSYCRNKYDNSDSYDIKVLAPEYVKFKRAKHK